MGQADYLSYGGHSQAATEPQKLVEHFFRHQSSRLVATLTRVLGVRRLELVEDVVQAAFAQALKSWATRGIPNDPAGWLFRVAKNLALDSIRRERLWEHSATRLASDDATVDDLLTRLQQAGEIADDQLRLLCLSCHPSLPAESQVAFALKLMCGFSTGEIAKALLTSEANVQKRIVRAKERLRAENLGEISLDDLRERLPIVLNVIYLLFNEGYNSASAERLIRVELCDEAIRLGGLLTEHSIGRTPATCALMALMAFHSARFDARTDDAEADRMVLLERQDRSRWHYGRINNGLQWLVESAAGDDLTTYHLEAGIAAEHCLAASFEATNWPLILHHYDLLIRLRPSVVHSLNRAIAVAYVHGPQAGLNALEQVDQSEIPANYYLWDAALGELHRRAGHNAVARRHLERASQLTASPQERELLRGRLQAMLESTRT